MKKGAKSGIGPNLFGIVGSEIAARTFPKKYSKAMSAKGGSWTPEALFEFLLAPKKAVPGTKMGFQGFGKKRENAAAVLAFLNSQSDAPIAFPKPKMAPAASTDGKGAAAPMDGGMMTPPKQPCDAGAEIGPAWEVGMTKAMIRTTIRVHSQAENRAHFS